MTGQCGSSELAASISLRASTRFLDSVGYTPAATPSAGTAGAASAAGGGGGAGAGAGVDSLAEKPEDEEELGCAHKISLRIRLREAGPQALSLSGCRRPLI